MLELVRGTKRSSGALVAAAASVAVLLGACTSALSVTSGLQSGGAATPSATASTPPASITISPSTDASGRAYTDAAIPVSVTDGTLDGITVTGPRSTKVAGTVDLAKGTWTPSHPLDLDATYTVAATARGTDGASADARRSFTTIDPTKTTTISISPSDGASVGNAQPVVVVFDRPVTNQKAAEKLLTVSDTDQVTGDWRWLTSRRVDYRPKTYWPVGDTVTVTADIEGARLASHVWGTGSTSATFTVTSAIRSVADLTAHTMTVYDGSKVLRTVPIGSGKPGFDTWGGSMVVLQKLPSTVMTSCSIGVTCDPGNANYYKLTVKDDVQLTWSGTFIHSAPWDGLIGAANTSHGCIHLRASDAQWFYGISRPGNLVTVVNAVKQVGVTNGDGDWNLTWARWSAPQKTVA